MRRATPIVAALAAVALVVVPYLALGGASYAPAPVADPCRAREWRHPGGVQQVLQQVVLSALDGAACKLGVSREELVLAVADQASLRRFAARHGISHAEAETALQQGLRRAIADAERAGALPGLLAAALTHLVDALPPGLVLSALGQLRSLAAALS